MALQKLTPTTLDDLLPILCGLAGDGNLACRGEPREYNETKPKIDRLLTGPKVTDEERVKVEWLAIRRFVNHAAVHCTPLEMRFVDGQVLGILAVMQHYGAPTRLVDWTLSLWVAVFNACQKDIEHDGVLYVFHIESVVNQIESEARAGKTEMSRLASDKLDEWPALSLKASDWINPIMMRMSNARMIAQQGMFTMAGRVNVDHIALLDQYSPTTNPVVRIVIRKESKVPLLRQLASMDITPASLFPGIEGVCGALEQSIKFGLPITMR
jgi:hypothetical protein